MSRSTTTVHLIAAADDAYAYPLAVMLRSAGETLRPGAQLSVHVIDGGLTAESRRRVVSSLTDLPVTLQWLAVDRAQLHALERTIAPHDHVSLACYHRLFAPTLLPDLDKVIYLDCDLVVAHDLVDLWELDLGEHPVAAVRDICQPTVSHAPGLATDPALPPRAGVFNTGVLVMNLQRWRSDDVGRRALEYAAQHRERIMFHDQDALNAICQTTWLELDPSWNQQASIYMFPSWRVSPYPEAQYLEALRSPKVIHFTTPLKPWNPTCYHPAISRFIELARKTAWRDRVNEKPLPTRARAAMEVDALEARLRFDMLGFARQRSLALAPFQLAALRSVAAAPWAAALLLKYRLSDRPPEWLARLQRASAVHRERDRRAPACAS